jgi:flagellar hook-length control protein FliK
MDALGLVVPQATITNAGSNTADASLLDARSDSTNLDFAALLAAELAPQLPASGIALPPPPAPTEGIEVSANRIEVAANATAPAASGDAAALSRPAAALLLTRGADRPAQADMPVALPVGEAHIEGVQTPKLAASGDKKEPETAGTPAKVAAAADLFAAAAPAPLTPQHAAFSAEAAPAPLALRDAMEAPALRTNDRPFAASDAFGPPAYALSQAPAELLPSARPTAVLDIPVAVDTPEFAPALAQQVVWMAGKDVQIAELRIDPPELGPVEVRLQLSGDEAVVQFVSAHADVRSALEGAIARLRESLAQSGIQLGEASVGAESFRDQRPSDAGRDERGFARARDGDHGWSDPLPAGRVQRGLVDLFA